MHGQRQDLLRDSARPGSGSDLCRIIAPGPPGADGSPEGDGQALGSRRARVGGGTARASSYPFQSLGVNARDSPDPGAEVIKGGCHVQGQASFARATLKPPIFTKSPFYD